MSIRVKSTQPGEYPTGHYKEAGKIFDVKTEQCFHESWMQKVDGAGKPIAADKAVAGKPAAAVTGKMGKGKGKGTVVEPVEPTETPETEPVAELSDIDSEPANESVI